MSDIESRKWEWWKIHKKAYILKKSKIILKLFQREKKMININEKRN